MKFSKASGITEKSGGIITADNAIKSLVTVFSKIAPDLTSCLLTQQLAIFIVVPSLFSSLQDNTSMAHTSALPKKEKLSNFPQQ
ncbi:MAG: hypothetical protein JKY08_11925 [Flavobacteriaceae bacterium]|nr:hypothetical protein [Flavobacteriaceae bacterium]